MSYIDWLRRQVGKHKILLTFASLVLRDKEGRLLLQRRCDFDAWGLPGGVLEIGENILACAHRELYEETGLTSGELNLVGVYSEPEYDSIYPNGDQVQQCTLCFQGQVRGGHLRADGLESRSLDFFKPGEIPFPEVLPWYQAMIRDALQGGEPAFAPPITLPDAMPQVEYMRSFLGNDTFIAALATTVTQRENGSLLVIQCQDEDKWCYPGDFLRLGENAAHAARRATYEKTGFQVEPQRILGIFSPAQPWSCASHGSFQPVVTVFHCLAQNTDLDADITAQAAWLQPEELLARQVSPVLQEFHQAVVEHLESGHFIL